MSAQIASFPALSQKIYHGKKGCPRTVVIQLLFSPSNGNANVFVGTDKAELDTANDPGNGILSYGVGIADLIGNNDRLVLQDVESDIYARGNNWAALNNIPAIVGVQDF